MPECCEVKGCGDRATDYVIYTTPSGAEQRRHVCHQHQVAVERLKEHSAGPGLCVVEGCQNKAQRRGLCVKHFYAARAAGNIDEVALLPKTAGTPFGDVGKHGAVETTPVQEEPEVTAEGEVALMREEIARLARENERLRAGGITLHASIKRLEEDLDAQGAVLQQAESEARSRGDRVAELEAEADDLRESIKALDAELTDVLARPPVLAFVGVDMAGPRSAGELIDIISTNMRRLRLGSISVHDEETWFEASWAARTDPASADN